MRIDLLKNERGSALIQIMITAGLIGIVAMGAATVASSLANENRAMNIRTQATAISSVVGAVVSVPSLCSKAIRVANDNPFNEGNAQSLTGESLSICSPSLSVDGLCSRGTFDDWFPRINGDAGKIPNLNLDISSIRFIANPNLPDSPVNPIDGKYVFPNGDVQYVGKLIVQTNSTSSIFTTIGPRTAVQNMKLVVSGGVIKGCSAEASAEGICKSLGGRYNENLTPKCEFGLESVMCTGPDEVLKGINGDGSPKCESIHQSCNDGEVVVAIQNGKIQCELATDWDWSDWGPCSGGFSSRTVRCVKAKDGTTLDDSYCLANSARPAQTASCSGPSSLPPASCIANSARAPTSPICLSPTVSGKRTVPEPACCSGYATQDCIGTPMSPVADAAFDCSPPAATNPDNTIFYLPNIACSLPGNRIAPYDSWRYHNNLSPGTLSPKMPAGSSYVMLGDPTQQSTCDLAATACVNGAATWNAIGPALNVICAGAPATGFFALCTCN